MSLSRIVLDNLNEEGIPKTKQTITKPEAIKYLKDRLSSIGATLKVKGRDIIITYKGGDLYLRLNFRGRTKTDFTITDWLISLENPKNKKSFRVNMSPRESEEEILKCLDSVVDNVPKIRFNKNDSGNHYYFDSELNRIKVRYNFYIKDLEDKIDKAESEEEIANLESQMVSFRDFVMSNYPDQYEDFKDIL